MPDENNQAQSKQEYSIRSNVSLSILDLPLAGKIGIKEVIVIQRILYWTKKAMENNIVNNYHDRHWWCYNSLRDWEKDLEGTISKSALSRILTRLERWGVIVVSNYNIKKFDDTKWYRIDADGLNLLLEAVKDEDFNKETYVGKDNKIFRKKNMRATEKAKEVSQNGTVYDSEWDSILPKMGQGCPKMSKPIPKNTKDIPIDLLPKNNLGIQKRTNYKSLLTRIKKNSNDNELLADVIIYFYKRYEECFGKQHGNITDEKLREVFKLLMTLEDPFCKDKYDKVLRFLMDKYINDDYFTEHHIYDFAYNIKDIYLKYVNQLWINSEETLKPYAINPYIEQKGA